MSKFRMCAILACLLCASFYLCAQFDISQPIPSSSSYSEVFGTGISLYDFDKDGKDDITIIDTQSAVRAYRNLGNSTYELFAEFLNNGRPKCINWVDFDNDGDADLFFTVFNSFLKFYRNDGDGVFTDISVNIHQNEFIALSTGASWGDYDRDGLLDLYVCNYESSTSQDRNWLFHNNGDESFTELAQILGVDNGMNKTFQSVWTDINLDGWQDLYIVNDRHDTNQVYINVAGVFEIPGISMGLDQVMESMSNSFTDFENDGDFDIYIGNTDEGNRFLKCENGCFQNIAENTDFEINGWTWSSLWIDYDLDGDDDLHLCNSNIPGYIPSNRFFENIGNDLIVFDFGVLPGDTYYSFSAAKGDLNQDGQWDFAITNQNPSSTSVFTNTCLDCGNWIKLGLRGTLSNRDGVGTVIRCYHGGMSNLLQTYCGENYLSQDSQYEIVGLGNDVLVDSLLIQWPSGWVDKYFNLGVNAFYELVEGESFDADIIAEQSGFLCGSADSIVLSAGIFADYLWSTGDTSQSIIVSQPGLYEVVVHNELGFESLTSILVSYALNPILESMVTQPTCEGFQDGKIELELATLENIVLTWSNGGSSTINEGLLAGEYQVFIMDEYSCSHEANFELFDPVHFFFEINADSIDCPGGISIASTAFSGGTPPYAVEWQGINPDSLHGGEYFFIATDSLGCISGDSLSVYASPDFEVINHTIPACYESTTSLDIEISGGTNPYSIVWNVQNPDSVGAGLYEYEIIDSNNCMAQGTIEVLENEEMFVVSMVTDANNGENGSILLNMEGGNPPFEFLWNTGANSNPLLWVGQGSYTCMVSDAVGCLTFTDTIDIIDVLVTEHQLTTNAIFPNPFVESVSLSGKALKKDEECVIFDNCGRIVARIYPSNNVVTMDTSDWSPGIYIMRCGASEFQLIRR